MITFTITGVIEPITLQWLLASITPVVTASAVLLYRRPARRRTATAKNRTSAPKS